ncbi:NAD(P)H-dependent oxidoreductase [Streptomyces noursei]|uniref:NAD(P)H-dependent oxidoreductase n=1 Tax=Streptomyces noursei TaxID=1971 RepID=UPI0019623ACB|nr:NAD(P)H-dependent oxidoreductase [Streptomyces noursei]QRX95218.1 NAD(P)H-dependent oxidoreductase [Streptomyces noursei]
MGRPGQLKNALDWASRPYGSSALSAKTAAVISASPAPTVPSGPRRNCARS